MERVSGKSVVASLLLGSASALAMGSSLVEADELSALKAQLEALQARVDQLSLRPEPPRLPEGASWFTVGRGSDLDESFAHLTSRRDEMPSERGFTIAVTPAADLPAPVHEVTIGGYVKGDVIYDFDQDLGDFFAFTDLDRARDEEHVRLHAKQSRFRIRSKSDTAVGQIRTLIEGDFFTDDSATTTSHRLRMRHAFGEWDMTPSWMLGVGQTWSNFMPLFDLADTVDFNGPAGVAFARQAQVRWTYSSGPLLAAVAVERPRTVAASVPGLGPVAAATERVPDFTGRFEYTFPGEHKVGVTGVIGEHRIKEAAGSDDEFIWGVIGAAQVHVTDRVIATASGGLGDGAGRYIIGADVPSNVTGLGVAPDIEGRRYYHISPNLAIGITDTITVNGAWGYVNFKDGDTVVGETDWLQTVHGNLMWQPVRQLKLGFEGMWAQRKIEGSGKVDAARAQFGAWFFF